MLKISVAMNKTTVDIPHHALHIKYMGFRKEAALLLITEELSNAAWNIARPINIRFDEVNLVHKCS